MVRPWSAVVVVALLAVSSVAAAVLTDSAESLNKPADSDDYLVKQAIWKKCHRKLTPACLKLSLVRTMEMMSKDSSYFLAPGVFFSSNVTDSAAPMPADMARSLSQEQAQVDDLVSYAVSRYMRSVTLNVNLVDFFSGGNETVQNSLVDAFSGRAKGGGGFGAYGGLAMVLGGSLASMMLAALAALAGKALMTSMLALMMAAMSAMKGSGGGGGGEHKTYEVITKPIVSHVNTHSSEVQHEHGGHHHYRRSLGQEAEAEPYTGYALDGHRLVRSANIEEVASDERKVFEEQDQAVLTGPDPKGVAESSETHEEKNPRNKRSLDNINKYLTRKDIVEINHTFEKNLQRNRRSVGEVIDQEKDSSEVHYAYSEFPKNDKNIENARKEDKQSDPNEKVLQREIRGQDQTMNKKTDLNTKANIHNSPQVERLGIVQRKRLPAVVVEKPKKNIYDSKVHFSNRPQELQRDKRGIDSYEIIEVAPVEGNLNFYKPPFKYIPNYPSVRIKRNIEVRDIPDSRIYHLNPNPSEYVSQNFPVRDQLFATGNRRYKRLTPERLIMPLTFVG